MKSKVITVSVLLVILIAVVYMYQDANKAIKADKTNYVEGTSAITELKPPTSSAVDTSSVIMTTTTSTTTKPPTTTTTVTTTEPPITTTTTTVTTTTEPVEEEPKVMYYDPERFAERRTYDNWLFVGDSRFEFWYRWGLYGTYISESGQGLNMIYDNYDEIMSYRDYNVVFNLGANQWWSGSEYVNLLNSFPDEFTENNHIIVMPVNPTDGYFSWMNEKFDIYNEIVKNNLRSDYEYFDTANYMKDNGFSTADGLHYTTNQDYIIYNFLMNGE